MKAHPRCILCLGAGLCLATLAIAQEASSANYVLQSSALTMSGGSASSETYSVTGSVGQPVAVGALTGTMFTADLGLLNDLDADGDGVIGPADACPMQYSGCNDADGDGCVDIPDVDADGDGVTAGACDCNEGNSHIWGRPGEVRNVRFQTATMLAWDLPADPGGTAPRYDLIRSETPRDFVSAAVCLESDDAADTLAIDPAGPAPGTAFYYLVRAENSCPGVGPLGVSKGIFARTARTCP